MKFEFANPAYYFAGGIKITGQVAVAIGTGNTTITGSPDGTSVRQNIPLGDGINATFTSAGNFGYTSTAQGEWLNGLTEKTGLEFNPWTASVTDRVIVQEGPVSITMGVTVQYTPRIDNLSIATGVVAVPAVFAGFVSVAGPIWGGVTAGATAIYQTVSQACQSGFCSP
jgi:hypothetical protein